MDRKTFLNLHAHKHERTPLTHFTPTGAQQEWIEMIGNHHDGLPRVKFFSGANKVLKTGATVACLASIIWGPPNEWFQYPLYEKWPYPRTVWIDSEDSTLKEILIPEMHKWFPKGKYTINTHGKTFAYHWICQGKDGEWNIFIKTYDTSAAKLESALLGLMIFSEPPPRDHYFAYPARMPSGGMVWMEFTPLTESAWVHDELLEDVEIDQHPHPHVERGKGGKLEVLYADVESACLQHGKRGIWTHRNIEQFVSEYDPEEAEARAHGKFAHLKGQVYKMPEGFIVDPWRVPANTQYWFVIDPHERRPPMVHWYAIYPFGDWKYELIYEYPTYEPGAGFEVLKDCKETISELCANFLKFEADYDLNITHRIMDPLMGAKRYSNTDMTVQQTYAKHGIKCSLPVKTFIDVGHDAVKLAMKSGQYRIRSTCMNTIRSKKNYKFEKQPRGDDKDLTIKVEEKWKDPMDLERYFFTNNPRYDISKHQARKIKGWRNRIKREKTESCGRWW
jgi:phage terminase large subunit-like protein